MITGDFEHTLGIVDYWANSDERDQDMFIGRILCGIFVFCAFNLLVAIIYSIVTKPGQIPVDQEWDLPDNLIMEYANNHKRPKQEQFINQEIIDN